MPESEGDESEEDESEILEESPCGRWLKRRERSRARLRARVIHTGRRPLKLGQEAKSGPHIL